MELNRETGKEPETNMNTINVKDKTKSYFLEELYYLVSDDDAPLEIETRCRKTDEVVMEEIKDNEERITKLMQIITDHEIRGFALGFGAAMKLR